MKKILSVILTALMLVSVFALAGCGKEEPEAPMSELILGDWYSYNGSPYRSFSEDGTVTGTNNYSSAYTIEDNKITWNSASGNTVTVEFWTDGEILTISSNNGAYFNTRKYYCRSAEGVQAGTGMPKRGTTDKAIFGTWYNGDKVFFALNEDGTVSGRRDTTGFSFFGDELVLFTSAASVDEVAACKLEGDTLTIYYTSETTGEQAEFVLLKGAAVTNDTLAGLTDEEIFLPDEENPNASATDAE